ncbi:hypothetical protein H7I53_18350 [Mycolicibacterium pulveris]|uniref:Uncharacterized protein n=1 Tax=Mycolicibacterium pulveris TaxID=36813 RepID=A0A7I7UVX1_MYCPV|nr:hypothetical protein [Mycolicibacterium pulveris]MCV6982178.1 hypothetical protein [Mycolicibacterium pulveris]BBY84176.1 hypothetical protein MPUL_53340 [Mycolicibacterium pulveris]
MTTSTGGRRRAQKSMTSPSTTGGPAADDNYDPEVEQLARLADPAAVARRGLATVGVAALMPRGGAS